MSENNTNNQEVIEERIEPQAWIQHAAETEYETADGSTGVRRGISLPCPMVGSGGVTISSLVDGGRNANGNFLGTIIGDDKLKYDISFASLTQSEFMQFLAIFDRKQGGGYVQPFIVFDPRINDYVKMDMYIGDRSGRPLMLDGGVRPTRWMDATATLIQV